MHEEVFQVNDCVLDKEQTSVVKSNYKNLLVIAGAGSGKTLTIIAKISYLISIKKIHIPTILCISFTNDSCINLKNKLLQYYNYDVEVLTFHKLAIKILNMFNVNYKICSSDLLEYIVNEYFDYIILDDIVYMKLVLKYFGYKYINVKSSYIKFITSENKKILKYNIITFIKLYKSSGHSKNYIIEIINKEKKKVFNKKNIVFLYLVLKILCIYNEELASSGSIDLDDLIFLATKKLQESNIYLNYKYVIIDEFQDTSLLRYKFITSVLKKSDASFMAVGDDYQSIYRFSGCDLSLFLNFTHMFKKSCVLKLQKTYRNSSELVNICGKFIQKNRKQLVKALFSDINLKNPVNIVYSNNNVSTLKKLIDYIYNSGVKELMILGRNNKDIYEYIDESFVIDKNGYIKYSKYLDLHIRYLTVHKAKGLESECVIVINLIDSIYGFPNKIKNDKIFKYVTYEYDNYPYSEERRLFYVALTRTKYHVYLLTKHNNESMFVKEIKHYKGVNIIKKI